MRARRAVPTLFTLTHPLDELKPLGALAEPTDTDCAMPPAPAATGDESSLAEPSASLACDPAEKLLFAHEDLPLIVSFNSRTARHNVWQLHR